MSKDYNLDRALSEALDPRPWLVRVKENKVAVGVYVCEIGDLYWLVDEVVGPVDCEAARMPFGGFHFSNNPVLPDHYRYKDLSDEETTNVGNDVFYPTQALSDAIDGDPSPEDGPLEWVDLETARANQLITETQFRQAQTALAQKRLNAHFEQIQLGEATIGQALQDRALQGGADLLVMGAFGHSRLREFILGGATREVLDCPQLPVLLSH